MYWGIDYCKSGWIAVGLGNNTMQHGLYESIIAFWAAHHDDAERVLINIPIGLSSGPSERQADLQAMKTVGQRSTSSFQTLTRQSLEHGIKHNFAKGVRAKASEINHNIVGKKITLQSWGNVPKIYEVDTFLRRTDSARDVFMETHPEVIFWAFSGKPMRYTKKYGLGFAERIQALLLHQPNAMELVSEVFDSYQSSLEDDDALEAVACAVAAQCSTLLTMPKTPEVDDEGLPMQIVYPDTNTD